MSMDSVGFGKVVECWCVGGLECCDVGSVDAASDGCCAAYFHHIS
jgi:hypothetical protein